MKESTRVGSILAVATAALTGATVVATMNTSLTTWQSLTPATCMPLDCFMERIADQSIRQPIASWSSLSFVAVAMFMILDFKRNGQDLGLPAKRLLTMWFALMVTGLGSFLYHASLTFVGQLADVFGMYLITIAVLLARIESVRVITKRAYWSVFLISLFSTSIIQFLFPEVRRFLFFALVLAVILVELLIRGERQAIERKYFFLALLSLGVGFIFWLIDRFRLLGSPEMLFQGHSVWHIFGAISSACIWLFISRLPIKEVSSSSQPI